MWYFSNVYMNKLGEIKRNLTHQRQTTTHNQQQHVANKNMCLGRKESNRPLLMLTSAFLSSKPGIVQLAHYSG